MSGLFFRRCVIPPSRTASGYGLNVGRRVIQQVQSLKFSTKPSRQELRFNQHKICAGKRSQSNQPKSGSTNEEKPDATWWERFTAEKPMPKRYSVAWYREMFLVCTVFGITGSSTMLVVRPAVSEGLGIRGSLKDGPWSYRLCSLVIMTPLYATLLVMVGTIFGRHAYFRHFTVKIFSRFGIPPELMDANFHRSSKTFQKW